MIDEVIYEEVKVQRESDGNMEQQQPHMATVAPAATSATAAAGPSGSAGRVRQSPRRATAAQAQVGPLSACDDRLARTADMR